MLTSRRLRDILAFGLHLFMRPAQGPSPLGRILTMGQTRIILAITLTFLLLKASADGPCKKCDIEKVKQTETHLDSLTAELVTSFLCTFDSICINNAEYSEWSNETLFKLMERAPQIFIDVVSKGTTNQKTILDNIENPVIETQLQRIYDGIKITKGSRTVKVKYLAALEKAANNDGQTLRR
jgi:hypothetical protein